jgi:hypothetical protein
MQQRLRHFSVLLAIAAALFCAPTAQARGGGHSVGASGSGHRHSSLSHSGPYVSNGSHRPTYAAGVERDAHGRIARSQEARHQFKKAHPCPSTGASSGACPGYVIDHVQPLKRGGADAPSNMQWQTKEEAKLKDRSE